MTELASIASAAAGAGSGAKVNDAAQNDIGATLGTGGIVDGVINCQPVKNAMCC